MICLACARMRMAGREPGRGCEDCVRLDIPRHVTIQAARDRMAADIRERRGPAAEITGPVGCGSARRVRK